MENLTEGAGASWNKSEINLLILASKWCCMVTDYVTLPWSAFLPSSHANKYDWKAISDVGMIAYRMDYRK